MESHCVELAAELVRRSRSVGAIVPAGSAFDILADRFRSAGATVHRIDTDGRRGRLAQLAGLGRMVSVIRRAGADVVHLHTGGATGGTAVVGLARLAGSATVVTEHDVPAERVGPRQRWSRALLDRWVDVLIAVSRRNAAERSARIRPRADRFAGVLTGVPIPTIDERAQEMNRLAVRGEYRISADHVLIGSVVRLAEGKGLRELLRALALVRSASMPSELLLVGDGPLRAELEALSATLGIDQVVHFAGNQSEPARFMDALDIFALTVPAGSGSIALMEAMARGVPAVITFCGPEEVIRPDETGICAPPNDPAGIAAALTRLVDDGRLRDSLGQAAAAHVRKHYSVTRVANDILDLYRSAGQGELPQGLRASGPLDPRPGDRCVPSGGACG